MIAAASQQYANGDFPFQWERDPACRLDKQPTAKLVAGARLQDRQTHVQNLVHIFMATLGCAVAHPKYWLGVPFAINH